MLGQAQQSAAPPTGTQSLEQRAYEQRTAGSYTFRMATPYWRQTVLLLLADWYATKTPEVRSNVARYPVASLVGMPPHMGTAGRSTGLELVEALEAQGWGVILIPEGPKGTLVRTKSAEQAEQLTMSDTRGTTVVLSEPADGWEDVSMWRYAALPTFFVVGLVAAVAVMTAVRG